MHKYLIALIPILLLLAGCDSNPVPTDGHALLDAKDYTAAIPAYREFLVGNSNARGAWVGKGIAHYFLSEGDSAWASLQKGYACEKNPEDPYGKDGVASYYMGLLAYGWFVNHEMASSYFQNALAAAYEECSAYTYLGLCVVNTDPVKAQDYYNKAVLADPKDTFARSNRAFLLATMGLYKDAVVDYDALIEQEPADKNHWGNRGYSKIGLEQWEPARMDFLKALELDPNYVDGIMYVGVCHLSQGETAKALEYFVRGVEMEPTYGRMYYYQGFTLAEMGLPAEACTALTKANTYGNQDGIRLMEEVCK